VGRVKDKFKGKYLIESYRHRLLDKLHNFRQGSMSIQDYMTAFDVITLHYEVQEDCLHVIFRFCLGLRSDIQCTMLIHSRNVTSLAQASQLAQDIDNSHKFSLECRFVLKVGEQFRRQPENTVRASTNTTKNPKDKSVIGESSKQGAKGT